MEHGSIERELFIDASPDVVFDVIDLGSADAQVRLSRYADGSSRHPEPGFWTPAQLGG